MKYTPQTPSNTTFDARKVAVRPQDDQLNEIGSVQILTPENGAVSVAVNGDITWGAVDGFSRYRIVITLQSDASEVVNTVVSGTSYTPSFNPATGYNIQVLTGRRIPKQAASTITEVSITGSNSLPQNGTVQLQSSVTGTGNFSSSVNWVSANESIATVDENGLVTYVSGNVNITIGIDAISVQDGTKKATKTLTIALPSSYTAQDSRAGDEAFMQAFWDATQGQGLTTLANTGELPLSPTRLDKFLINDELHIFIRGDWRNYGRLWFERDGWVDGAMDLSAPNITGVTVDTVDGELRITRFDMQKVIQAPDKTTVSDGNNLVGTLPPEWGNLTKCDYFNIKQNHFVGGIPDTLQPSSVIEWISLGGQRCDLDIRNVSWNAASHLGCGDGTSKSFQETNQFNSPLPTTLGTTPSVVIFECRRQYLTGTIPTSIGGLTNIEGIFIDFQKGINAIGGDVPTELGNLTTLRHLHMSNANFGTPGPGYTSIPQSLINLSELRHIRFPNCSLEGDIPIFSNAFDIRVLDLGFNNLTGSFPIEIFQGENAYLQMLDLKYNNLSGPIPESIQTPTVPDIRPDTGGVYSPTIFGLTGNNFSGPIPEWVQELYLVQCLMDENAFTGPFPVKIAEGPAIRLFWFSFNQLSGPLLDANWVSSGLLSILIKNNNFEGPIPESWGSIVTNNLDSGGNYTGRLNRFEANDNDLSGVIPAWFADVTTLPELELHRNRFTYSDILPNYSAILANIQQAATAANRSPIFNISSQKPFPVPQETFNVATGNTVTLNLSSIDYANNVYQWRKGGGSAAVNLSNGGSISGATSHTLTITNAQPSDSGVYQLRITNPDLPALAESLSKEIQVTIS